MDRSFGQEYKGGIVDDEQEQHRVGTGLDKFLLAARQDQHAGNDEHGDQAERHAARRGGRIVGLHAGEIGDGKNDQPARRDQLQQGARGNGGQHEEDEQGAEPDIADLVDDIRRRPGIAIRYDVTHERIETEDHDEQAKARQECRCSPHHRRCPFGRCLRYDGSGFCLAQGGYPWLAAKRLAAFAIHPPPRAIRTRLRGARLKTVLDCSSHSASTGLNRSKDRSCRPSRCLQSPRSAIEFVYLSAGFTMQVPLRLTQNFGALPNARPILFFVRAARAWFASSMEQRAS